MTKEYDPQDHGARCDLCPLGGPDRIFCPPSPPASGKVKLVIVGEGPGRHELVMKEPFIGQSGQLLDTLLEEAGGGHVRKDAWVTNAALCRAAGDQEADEAAACCAPRLLKEISELPKEAPILSLGKPATRTLLGVNGIMRARGFVWTMRELSSGVIKGARRNAEKAIEKGASKEEAQILKLKADALELRAALAHRVVLPSVHPAFVLRTEIWRPVLASDIDRAVRLLKAKERGRSFHLLDQLRLIPGGRFDPKIKNRKGTYQVLSSKKDVKAALSSLGSEISHDIETDSKDPLEAVVRCVGVSDGERTFVIFPWEPEKHKKLLSECFSKRVVIGHNSFAYDEIALKKVGVRYPKETEDTILGWHAFASHLPHGLSFVVSFYLDSSPWKITFKHGAEGAEKGIPPSKLPPEDLCRYNAADCVLSIAAWHAMQADLKSERRTYEHDKENGRICQEMQINGILVDQPRREYLSKALARRAARMLKRIRALTKKKSFNPYRTADIRYALFTQFKAPPLEMTAKTGMPSTSASVLQALAREDTRAGKLSRLILKYRGARGTNQRNIIGVVVGADGRVHAAWRSFGTMNGRYSCKMQQLPRAANPKKPILEDRIRELYIAAEGKIYVYFDLSQAEMRGAAHLSKDPEFIKVCTERDVHSGNALLIFPEAADLIRNDPKGTGKDFRDIAKETGFAVNYLAGEETLFLRLQSKKLKTPVSLKVVRQMLMVVHKKFAQHFRFIDHNIKDVQQCGHMRSPLIGRIRWFGWNPPAQEIANTPVQQFVGDLMNLRLMEIRARMRRDAVLSKNLLVGQFHDAALFECPEGECAEAQKALIKEVFSRDVELPNGQRFVMPIDMKEGHRLSEVT